MTRAATLTVAGVARRLEHGLSGRPPPHGGGPSQRKLAVDGNVDHGDAESLRGLEAEALRAFLEDGLRAVDAKVEAGTVGVGERAQHDLGPDSRRVADGDGYGERGLGPQRISIVAQIGSAPAEQAV